MVQCEIKFTGCLSTSSHTLPTTYGENNAAPIFSNCMFNKITDKIGNKRQNSTNSVIQLSICVCIWYHVKKYKKSSLIRDCRIKSERIMPLLFKHVPQPSINEK